MKPGGRTFSMHTIPAKMLFTVKAETIKDVKTSQTRQFYTVISEDRGNLG